MTGKIRKCAALCALAALAALMAAATADAADVQVVTTSGGLPSNWVSALAEGPDGMLWVGTGDAGVYRLDPAKGTGKGFRVPDGLSSDAIVSIASYGGKVYVGTSEGLSVYDGNSWTSIRKVENVTMRNVRLAASPDGKELWACSVYLAGGTVRLDAAGWKFMGGEGRGLFNDVQGFAFLTGAVLMGAGSGTAYVRKGEEFSVLAEGLPAANVFSAGVLGGKWLLGTSRGLYAFQGKWGPVSLPRELSGEPVFAIASAGGRTVVGTAGGLALLGEGEPKLLTDSGGLPSSRVTAAAVTADLVAAGTAKGLALVRGWH